MFPMLWSARIKLTSNHMRYFISIICKTAKVSTDFYTQFFLWWNFFVFHFFFHYFSLFFYFCPPSRCWWYVVIRWVNFFVVPTKYYAREYYIQDWAVLIVFKCLCACMNFLLLIFCCPFFIFRLITSLIMHSVHLQIISQRFFFRIQLIKWFEID